MVTTDFSAESQRAFFHALAFAVSKQARLTLLHTGPESRRSVPWENFPGVRETLAGWGLLPRDAPRSAVADTLNLGIAKMAMRDDNPRQGITEYLRKHPTDLLVMATEGRTGLARLFNPSVAETVSYCTRSHTLMLPKGGRGFVDPETGRTDVKRVLCAIDPYRDPRPALGFLKQWLPILGGAEMDILMLQNCDPEDAEELPLPKTGNLSWREVIRPGEAVATIVSAAREMEAELVVMTSHSPLKPMARMRGSLTDKVLRDLRVPLLSMPAI